MPDYYFKVRILKYVSHNYYDFHMSMNFAEESTKFWENLNNSELVNKYLKIIPKDKFNRNFNLLT